MPTKEDISKQLAEDINYVSTAQRIFDSQMALLNNGDISGMSEVKRNEMVSWDYDDSKSTLKGTE